MNKLVKKMFLFAGVATMLLAVASAMGACVFIIEQPEAPKSL